MQIRLLPKMGSLRIMSMRIRKSKDRGLTLFDCHLPFSSAAIGISMRLLHKGESTVHRSAGFLMTPW
jgi:hypothetical protein